MQVHTMISTDIIGHSSPLSNERKNTLLELIFTPIYGNYIDHLDILEKEYRIIPEYVNEYGRVVCITCPVSDEHHKDCEGCFGVNYGILVNIFQTRDGFFIQEFSCEQERWYDGDEKDVMRIVDLMPNSAMYIAIDP